MRKLRRPSGGLWANGDFVKLWSGQSISEFGSQVSALAIPLLAATQLHASPLAFSLLASVAAFGGEVTAVTPSGTATMQQALGDVEVSGRLLPHAVFQPFLLVKSGAYTLRAQGTNGPVVRSARTWTGTTGGGAGVRAVVSQGFALVLSGELSFAWSRSIVRIADREVATAGSPAALYGATVVGVF